MYMSYNTCLGICYIRLFITILSLGFCSVYVWAAFFVSDGWKRLLFV